MHAKAACTQVHAAAGMAGETHALSMLSLHALKCMLLPAWLAGRMR
jgi:hypothetical protein